MDFIHIDLDGACCEPSGFIKGSGCLQAERLSRFPAVCGMELPYVDYSQVIQLSLRRLKGFPHVDVSFVISLFSVPVMTLEFLSSYPGSDKAFMFCRAYMLLRYLYKVQLLREQNVLNISVFLTC